jgi:hypothetical protein
VRELLRAALSPAPAQPATAAKEETASMASLVMSTDPHTGELLVHRAAPPSPAAREHCDDCGDLSDGGTHLKSCPSAVISSNRNPVEPAIERAKMFECHLTFDMKDAETVRAYGGDKRMWKYSQIDGDPVLGAKVFCYLSAHDNDFTSMRTRMDSMTRDLADFAGVSPIRRKIEIIVIDER